MRQWPIDEMKIDEKTALVLEGGGLRGVFTCGVLDCFMERGIRFPFTVGVSADSIPVEYASRQGYEKIVVVLTRNRGYRKKESRNPLMKLFYRKYPALQKAIAGRNAEYNRTMELIERMEDEGRMTVLRPLKPVEVGRMEKDTDKLRALYDEGYAIAQQLMIEL